MYSIYLDTYAFVGLDLTAVFEVKAAQGDVKTYPDFEVKITPTGQKAKGKYLCSVSLKKSATDVLPTEYKSNVWNGSFSAIPSVVFLAFLAVVALKFQ